VKYDAATVALRVVRLVAVASIFAFGFTARTVTATQAHTDDAAADPPPAVVDLPPTDLGEQPRTDPTPTDPTPTNPPVAAEPPPADPVGPAPTDPPPADTPPPDPPVTAEPPPSVNSASDAPSPSDPAVPAPTASPVPDPSPTIGDLDVSDPSAAEPVPPLPSALPSPVAVSPLAEDPAHTATTPTAAAPRAAPTAIVGEPVVPAHHAPAAVPPAARPAEAPRSVAHGGVPHMTGLVLPDEVEPVTAGLVGLVVRSGAPASVAVAIEFGRAGGGWAGAIVFNLWLRRKLRERPISQRQLAALSGVDHSTISRLLLHDQRPSLATATKLAKALRYVYGEQGEADTLDYFERMPEETLFPARRVEMALRADELLADEEVLRLMSIYLDARRRREGTTSSNGRSSNGRTSASAGAAPTRAGPTRAPPGPRR
jgi:transcriptional regulator with XRE-family HTH domain